jgi:uncharacterized protein
LTDWASLAAIAAAGLVVGAFVGGTGIGGFLMIPAMMVFGGIPVRAAMGTALLASGIMSLWSGWLYLRKGNQDWSLGLPLAAGAGLFSVFAARLNALLPVALIVCALALVMILGSLSALRQPLAVSVPALAKSPRMRFAMLVLVGMAAGLASGLTGAGGPLVAIPILAFLGFPMLPVIGASQLLQLAACLSGAATFVDLGQWSWVALLALMPGLLTGISFGARWAHRVDPVKARRLVAILGMLSGVALLLAALSQSGLATGIWERH